VQETYQTKPETQLHKAHKIRALFCCMSSWKQKYAANTLILLSFFHYTCPWK